MIFTPTELDGAVLIDLEPHRDERGFFARSFCAAEFAAHGLDASVLQCSLSRNPAQHTLRGMHFQHAPMQEVKLVRCVRGSLWDVIIDLRPQSPTFMKHLGVELSAENGRALHVAAGFAHGFLTLADDTDVLYQMSQFHDAARSRGVRWNDPAFAIDWPAEPALISDRDAAYSDFDPTELDAAASTPAAAFSNDSGGAC